MKTLKPLGRIAALFLVLALVLGLGAAPAWAGGMLISASASGLAIKAASPTHGAALVLASGCQRNIPGCSWTYRDGMFVSDTDPSLAIAAWGGARYGTTLRLSNGCRAGNADCNWSRPR